MDLVVVAGGDCVEKRREEDRPLVRPVDVGDLAYDKAS